MTLKPTKSAPLVAWSHSSLEVFDQCPRKYYATKVSKEIKDTFKGPLADWGLAVHKAMERRVRMGVALPHNMSQYEQLATMLEGIPGKKLTEQQLAVNENHQPTGWFDPDVWCRAVVDLLIIHPSGTKAFVADYKTGKVKADDKQLALCAAVVMCHYPEVDQVTAGYLWMEPKKFDRAVFTRKHIDKMWGLYLPSLRRLEQAVVEDNWPPKPSGLCRGYCPVHTCEFWQPKRTH